jgi:hypothetical protein
VEPKVPSEPRQIEAVAVTDLSVRSSDGVIWAGEHEALAAQREKEAFVSQLVALGYRPQQFRVTIRGVPPEAGARPRYTVLVAQLLGRVPYSGRRYVGGHGVDWVHDFSRTALTDFPRDLASL